MWISLLKPSGYVWIIFLKFCRLPVMLINHNLLITILNVINTVINRLNPLFILSFDAYQLINSPYCYYY